ncbi:PH domain-containing protein [Thalassotalea maritima]|uniref:PH domain-containing protein n=1 Tax=Thalassotalea maritima TaxID=3242416 RepID=UPI0035284942
MSEFSNNQINSSQLSSLQQLDFQPLAIAYPPLHRKVSLYTTLLFVAVCAIIINQPWLTLPSKLLRLVEIALYISAVVGLLTTLYRHIADPKKGYALREQDLSYQSGLVFRSVVTQPILRIQHVEIKRGPLERQAGLANLQVFSAGGAAYTFEIPGLSIQTAENIRQYILSHKDLGLHG